MLMLTGMMSLSRAKTLPPATFLAQRFTEAYENVFLFANIWNKVTRSTCGGVCRGGGVEGREKQVN